MKRYVHSDTTNGLQAYKRKDIRRKEYDAAIEVGKEVLRCLHENHPDIFFYSEPRSIRREYTWVKELHVRLNTGVSYREVISNYSKYDQVLEFKDEIDEEIRNEILPDLGISWNDFQVSLDPLLDRVYIVVYDMNTSSELD